MKVGIDMVHVFVKPDQFRVHNAAKFNHRPPIVAFGQSPDIWGVTENGQELTGTIFVNRGKGGHEATVEVKSNGLHIQFNPSKMIHPYELTADIRAQTERVKSLVHELGVDVDIDSSGLSRLDLAKQAQMGIPLSGFATAFTALNGKRTKKKVQYPDGFEIGNKSRSTVCYDKFKEQILLGVLTPPNMLRIECRWQGAKVIGHTTTGVGVGTLKDLVCVDVDQLTESYNRYLLNDIFKTKNTGIQLSFDMKLEIDLLSSWMEDHTPRKAVDYYLSTSGFDHLLSVFGSVTAFRDYLMTSNVPRATAYRIAQYLEELQRKSMWISTLRNKSGISKNLDTLRRVFAA